LLLDDLNRSLRKKDSRCCQQESCSHIALSIWLIIQLKHATIEKSTNFSMPKASKTRERLVESARYLFWERGFAGTSMADLLTHAEVNSGSFYHFFESKEALLRAVLQTYKAALRPMVVDPAFAQTQEPVERIFAILAGYRDRILQTECRYGCPLGRLALEIDPENRPAHRLIAENFQGWIGAIRECVEQMKHHLPAGSDLDALATYVLAVMEGGVMLSRSYGSVDPFDLSVSQLRGHFRLLLSVDSTLRAP
jgi:TetR/AcrR family transcriptional regulator, transcriptional repressor for nem operon